MNNEIKERYIRAKRALFDKAYASLNEKQREAVFTTEKPLLVLAGAGSGKTTVLVKRIAFIIKYGNAYYSENVPESVTEEQVHGLELAADLPTEEIEQLLPVFINNPCPPWQVLAITFTNKAANEIKTRLAGAFSGNETIASDIWAGTFHSICMRILRKYGDRIGYGTGFSIYDTDDVKKLISSCMKILNIDEKIMPIKTVMNEIGRAKDKLITPEMYAREAGVDFRLKKVADIYTEYEKQLKASNSLDFDDIIMETVKLLREDEEVRTYYQKHFKYVCVDEYQDTNHAQYELVRLLSSGENNICVVGDDDQSIYRFRGATIENILNFEDEYGNARVIRLEQNYRSTSNILDAANAVIKNNRGRKGKILWTDNGTGEKISVFTADDERGEARYIADRILENVKNGAKFSDHAVLYRMNAQSGSVENVFARSGIAYRVIGGLRFFDRKEIKDVIAYLQLVNNNNDDLRLRRIINEPKRGIGETTMSNAAQIAAELGISLFEVIKRADEFAALSRAAVRLRSFCDIIDELTEMSADISVSELPRFLKKQGTANI